MNKIKESFESITPTELQKKRMLKNILEARNQTEPEKTVKGTDSKIIVFEQEKLKPFLAITASLVLVVSSVILSQNFNKYPSNQLPAMPSIPQSSEQILEYRDATYKLVEELDKSVEKDLIEPLMEVEISEDFIDIIWKIKGYEDLSAVVVEHLEGYYLYQRIE